MATDESVREFYNDFSMTVLLQGFYRVNPRIEAIKALCDRFIPAGAVVLEIGCGVGIVSNHLKRRASRLLSVDIGDVNIQVASAYAGGDNAEFRVVDVLADDIPGQFDAIVLPDVIEHIPAANHSALLARLESRLDPGGVMIFTFPSPEYQRYLRSVKPEALQIVDETVHPRDLLGKTSLAPEYLSYVSVFGLNDYVHLVLAREAAFSPEGRRLSLLGKASVRLANLRWRLRNRSFIRRLSSLLQERRQR